MKRGKFEGVGNIVRFNWPMYAGAAVVLAIGGILARVLPLPRWARRGITAAEGGAGFYLLGSLAVSHWIYDRSRLYRWDWLSRFVPESPRRILNVHAGFDESSASLRQLYPEAKLAVVDFYDPVKNPEPSIARARRAYPPDPATVAVELDDWPLAEGWADLAVLFLAAHEVRTVGERRRLFDEVREGCRMGGRVVVVEHLRDVANFAAYGPGFLHFHSRAAWLASLGPRLRLVDEGKITPFVQVFCFEAV